MKEVTSQEFPHALGPIFLNTFWGDNNISLATELLCQRVWVSLNQSYTKIWLICLPEEFWKFMPFPITSREIFYPLWYLVILIQRVKIVYHLWLLHWYSCIFTMPTSYIGISTRNFQTSRWCFFVPFSNL